MSCVRTRQMLDGWLDGELDAGTSAELSGHAAQCPECSVLKRERETLRATLRAAPRFPAPATLRRAVQAAAEAAVTPAGAPPPLAPSRSLTWPRSPSWWQAIALAGASAVCAVLVTLTVLRASSDEGGQAALREQVVARHVAALASRRLIEVASSDRHVVKPWLLGKVDFAPQVPDLAAQGFALDGARLDQVEGKAAVALVYRLREHPVHLFVWRSAESRDAALALVTVRGFSVATWSAGGLHHAAVSDADAAEVGRFARALQAANAM